MSASGQYTKLQGVQVEWRVVHEMLERVSYPWPRPSLIRRAICTSENEDFALAIIKVQYAFSQHNWTDFSLQLFWLV